MKSCLPPDSSPVIPEKRLPAGACDAHCHVFGPASRFPYADDRTYTPPDAPVDKLRALHAHLGISRAVIVHASCHGTDNRVTLDAIASSGGAYRGIANVDPQISDNELQALDEGGIRGIRFNFVKHLGGVPDASVVERMVDRVAPLGWHIVLHLDAQDLLEHERLLRRIRVPFVIDHMGRVQAEHGVEQAPFRSLLRLMVENPWAWSKICGAERVSIGRRPFRDAIPFAQALIEAAPERLLWGTDWPHPNITKDMPNDGELVNLFLEFSHDTDVQRQILVTNPERLYGFK
jgi:predicted TIM-barrel fold metal-dependent hydrolase